MRDLIAEHIMQQYNKPRPILMQMLKRVSKVLGEGGIPDRTDTHLFIYMAADYKNLPLSLVDSDEMNKIKRVMHARYAYNDHDKYFDAGVLYSIINMNNLMLNKENAYGEN